MDKYKNKIHNLLRKSEKYTKTDMVYLVSGGFWLTFGQIISSIATFLLAIAFANLFPKETYGIYKYILSIAGILSITTLPGMETAITQAVARGYEGSVIPALKIKIQWGLLGSMASIAIAGYYFMQANAILAVSFFIISFFIPISDSFAIYHAILSGKKNFKSAILYEVISKMIIIPMLIGILWYTKNIPIILFSYFALWTLLRFIFFKRALKKFPLNAEKDPGTISYGKHLSFINIIAIIATHIDKILVFHYLGAIDLAIYTFAVALPEQMKGVLKGISMIILPKFSERNIRDIKKTIIHKMLLLGSILAVSTIIYILAAPYIFQILFPQYMQSVFYSQIFSLSLIAAIGILPVSALQAKSAKKQLYELNTYGSIAQIIILFVLVRYYGLLGMILARVLIRFVNLIFSMFLFKKLS